MAKNYKQPGEVLTHIAAAAITSGEVVVIGTKIGVAQTSAVIGGECELRVEGVFTLDKTTGQGAIAQGAILYWDDATNKITNVAAANKVAGFAAAPAATGDLFIDVKINA